MGKRIVNRWCAHLCTITLIAKCLRACCMYTLCKSTIINQSHLNPTHFLPAISALSQALLPPVSESMDEFCKDLEQWIACGTCRNCSILTECHAHKPIAAFPWPWLNDPPDLRPSFSDNEATTVFQPPLTSEIIHKSITYYSNNQKLFSNHLFSTSPTCRHTPWSGFDAGECHGLSSARARICVRERLRSGKVPHLGIHRWEILFI